MANNSGGARRMHCLLMFLMDDGWIFPLAASCQPDIKMPFQTIPTFNKLSEAAI